MGGWGGVSEYEKAFEDSWVKGNPLPRPSHLPQGLQNFWDWAMSNGLLNREVFLSNKIRFIDIPDEYERGVFYCSSNLGSPTLLLLSLVVFSSKNPSNEMLLMLKNYCSEAILKSITKLPIDVFSYWIRNTNCYPYDPEIVAWLGAAITIEATKTENGIEKLNYVKEGSSLLDKTVEEAPTNLVVRIIRSTTYTSLPQVFYDLRSKGVNDIIFIGRLIENNEAVVMTSSNFSQVKVSASVFKEEWDKLYKKVVSEGILNGSQKRDIEEIRGRVYGN